MFFDNTMTYTIIPQNELNELVGIDFHRVDRYDNDNKMAQPVVFFYRKAYTRPKYIIYIAFVQWYKCIEENFAYTQATNKY